MTTPHHRSLALVLMLALVMAFVFAGDTARATHRGVAHERPESRWEALEGFPPLRRWLLGASFPVNYSPPWPEKNEHTLKVGKTIYELRCAVCHGPKGDGNGERAKDLSIPPRDFRWGMFKFRSTPTGAMPTGRDLFKTISHGLHGTAMSPWTGLTNSQKWMVIYYIKSFCEFFETDEAPDVVTVPEPSRPPHEYVALGKEVYKKAQCGACHGEDGYGGPKASTLKDDTGRPIRTTNFREQVLKRGLEIEEIYLTFATGLNGTPMPSYSMALNEEEMLGLAYYIQSLAPDFQRLMESYNKDEDLGLRIDHMQGIRFPMPMWFNAPR